MQGDNAQENVDQFIGHTILLVLVPLFVSYVTVTMVNLSCVFTWDNEEENGHFFGSIICVILSIL
jgi:hypothetical protein